MKYRHFMALLVVALLIGCKPQPAEDLEGGSATTGKIGALAAPLTGLEWVKGGPVEMTAGQLYVVEFWATWCPPCRVSIPHLTEIQAKFRDQKVQVIGISTEAVETVKPFVEAQGDKMDYAVAVDLDQAVSKAYMQAFNQNGIPHAFVVDAAGLIAWHGHPMDGLDEVLTQVLAGSFDAAALQKAKDQAQTQAQVEHQKAEDALQRAVDEVTKAIEEDPNNPVLLAKRAAAWLGESFSLDLAYRPDRLPKALADYQAALAVDPADPAGVADDIAFLTAWMIDGPERSDALKKFAEDYPDSIRRPFALFDLYYQLQKEGRLEDALAVLDEMRKNCPQGRFMDFITETSASIRKKLEAPEGISDQE